MDAMLAADVDVLLEPGTKGVFAFSRALYRCPQLFLFHNHLSSFASLLIMCIALRFCCKTLKPWDISIPRLSNVKLRNLSNEAGLVWLISFRLFTRFCKLHYADSTFFVEW